PRAVLDYSTVCSGTVTLLQPSGVRSRVMLGLRNHDRRGNEWGTTMSIRASTLGLAVAALALATPAGAADLGRPITKAPPVAVPPPFTWSGCYLGGFVGGAWQDDAAIADLGNGLFGAYAGGITTPVGLAAPHTFGLGSSDGSFIGGGTLGCNWQPVGSPFVLGIEGEGGYMRLTSAAFDPFLAPGVGVGGIGLRGLAGVAGTPDVLGASRVGDWYAMITGRVGYAWDRWMIYAKGGAAFLPTRGAVADGCTSTAPGFDNWLIAPATNDDPSATWTTGGGVEWAFAPNWSIKAEYMYINAPDATVSCGTATLASGAIVPGGPFCFGHSFGNINTVKVGLNW